MQVSVSSSVNWVECLPLFPQGGAMSPVGIKASIIGPIARAPHLTLFTQPPMQQIPSVQGPTAAAQWFHQPSGSGEQ